jgi:cell division protein FtsN
MKDYKEKSQLVNFDDNEFGYFIQLGAFSQEKNADKMANNILEFGDPTITPIAFNDKTLYRVRIGPVVNYYKAKNILGNLHDNGFNTAAIVN